MISVSIFPVDSTFAIKIAPLYFMNNKPNYHKNQEIYNNWKTTKVLPLKIFYAYG